MLDDGWFGSRRDDTSGLGDWVVSTDAHPQGLGPLIEHVTGLGMQFGIWVEPVGAGNSAVVVDLPRWGPMLSPRVPNLVPIPGPRVERETPSQRPGPYFGHPCVS